MRMRKQVPASSDRTVYELTAGIRQGTLAPCETTTRYCRTDRSL